MEKSGLTALLNDQIINRKVPVTEHFSRNSSDSQFSYRLYIGNRLLEKTEFLKY